MMAMMIFRLGKISVTSSNTELVQQAFPIKHFQ